MPKGITFGAAATGWRIFDIGVFAALLLAFSANVTPIAVDSQISVTLDPARSIWEFSFGWHDGRVPGAANLGNTSYIAPFGILFLVGSLFEPSLKAHAFYLASQFFYGYVGIRLCIRGLLPEAHESTVRICSLIYLFNPYTLTTVTGAYSVLLWPYFSLPYLLYFLRQLIVANRLLVGLAGLSLATSVMGGINPPLIGINLIACCIYSLVMAVKEDVAIALIVRRLILGLIVVALTNAWWLVGAFAQYGHAAVLGDILSESIDVHSSQAYYYNIFRYLGLWAIGATHQGQQYFEYAPFFLSTALGSSVLFIPVVVSVCGLIVVLYKSNASVPQWALFGLALLMFGMPMAAGVGEGIFGPAYRWLYDNVPGFAMFRSTYKFQTLISLGYCILSAGAVDSVINIATRRIAGAIVTLAGMLMAYPIFSGVLISEDKKIFALPASYAVVTHFFESKSDVGNILLLPEQYFAVFRWGRTMGNPEEIVWRRPIVSAQPGSPLTAENQIFKMLHSQLMSGDKGEICEAFRRRNVTHIVVRKDFDFRVYPDRSIPWQAYRRFLDGYSVALDTPTTRVHSVNCGKSNDSDLAAPKMQKISPVEYIFSVTSSDSAAVIELPLRYDTWWRAESARNADLDTATRSCLEPDGSSVGCLAQLALVRPIRRMLTSQGSVGIPGVTDDGLSNRWTISIPKELEQGVGKDSAKHVRIFYIGQDFLILGVLLSICGYLGLAAVVIYVVFRSRNALRVAAA